MTVRKHLYGSSVRMKEKTGVEKKSPLLLYLLARAQECGEDLGAGFCGGSKGFLRNARGEGRIWERDRDFQIRKYRSSHSANTSFLRRRLYVRRRMLEDGEDTPSSVGE